MHEADRQVGDTPSGPDAGSQDGAPGGGNDSTSGEPSAPVQEVRLHDVVYNYPEDGPFRAIETKVTFLLLGAGIAIACAVLLLIVWGDPVFAVSLSMPMGLLAAFVTYLWKGSRDFARILAGHTSDEPVAVLRAIVSRHSYYEPASAVQKVLKHLVKRGIVGHALRLHGRVFIAKVAPIPVRFEPIPLDALHPTFEALARDDAESSTAGPAGSAAVSKVQSDGGWRELVHHLRKFGNWPGVFMLYFWIGAMVKSVRIRSITPDLILWTVLLGFTVFGRAIVAHGSGAEWYLVPGGLLVRKPAKGRAGWDLHVFKAKESILCAFQLSSHRWGLAVADAAGCEQCVGVAAEAHVALRAWLSPQEPLSVEMLTDLQ